MAQTAMSIQMDQVVGVTYMPEAMAAQVAVKMLKNFRKIVLEIEKRERKAKATGNRFLDKYQQQLAVVGRNYAQQAGQPGIVYKEKFERFFGEQATLAAAAGNQEDASALTELETYMIGTTAWGERDEHLGYVVTKGTDWRGKIVTFDREEELRREEMGDLLDERDFVMSTIKCVEAYHHKGAFLLEQQYMKGKKVADVIDLMIYERLAEEGLAESTYHHWRKEALKVFAQLAGLC